MRKRLRKKLAMGEFKVFGFELRANYEKIDEKALDKMIDDFLVELDKFGGYCGGSFEDGKIDVFIVTGLSGDDNEKNRQAITDYLKAQPGVKEVKAGELVDANR